MSNLNDHLRDVLLDHVLTAPDINLLQQAREAQDTVDSVSLDSLAVSDEGSNIDNSREIRDVDRDLDTAKDAVKSLASEVADAVLFVPFEKALTVSRAVGMTFDDWNPERWLDLMGDLKDQQLYERVANMVVRHIDPNDALPWLSALSKHAPWPNLVGNLWSEVLSSVGSSDATVSITVGRMIDGYLNDDTLAEPTSARAAGDSSTRVRDVKLKDVQKRAFQAFYNQNSSSLRDHVWQHHGMDLNLLKWDRVINSMVSELCRHNNNSRDMPLKPIEDKDVRLVTLWMTRLTDTGHLDAWLAQPEQWTPVEPPPAGSNGAVRPREAIAWMEAHANAGTFTWTILITGMNALNQPGVAQEFKRLGERWSLAHEANLIAQDTAPVVRERARL